MPTYEYRCTECEHEFEAFQMMSDEPLDTCPECGGKPKRLIGKGAGIIFKGSGFYQTDYRSDNYRQAAEKEKKSSTANDSSESSTAADKKSSGAADTAKKKTSSAQSNG